MAAEDKFNMKNPAVKRILQEIKDMHSNPSDDFMSLPLEENIFEWQFAIRGPLDSEFEGGIYHGRIQLPAEYPFKPPSFMLLTPNGRFETQTKICLSISSHHPEHWQPSWSVRTALVALIAFMPTSPNGAIGSLDYKKEERRKLAIKSHEAAPRYGTPERQKLIDKIHDYMLSKSPPVPQLPSSEETTEGEQSDSRAAAAREENSVTADPRRVVEEQPLEDPLRENWNPPVEEVQPIRQVAPDPLRENWNPPVEEGQPIRQIAPAREQVQTRVHRPAADDRLFTWAAVGLTIAIVILLLKKLIKSSGHGAVFMDGS